MAYLDIGNEKAIRSKNIIGIFDMDTATVTKDTKKFLKNSEKSGLLYSTYDIPRTFLLTDTGTYLSQVSPVSLKKRLED